MNGIQKVVTSALVAGLVGCGSGYPRTYDVEFDAAELANVPTECGADWQGPPPQGGALNVAAKQRWTFDELKNASDLEVGVAVEMPDIDVELPAGPFRMDEDDAPDVFTSMSVLGALNFANTQSLKVSENVFETKVFRVAIREVEWADTIHGYIGVYRELQDRGAAPSRTVCISTLNYTAHLVE